MMLSEKCEIGYAITIQKKAKIGSKGTVQS